jgi:peptidoglycan/xylan/chitin deacetylase (PgdA/CDA1 family)
MVNFSYPNNKKFALCLTHDVDRVQKTYQYITHLLREKRAYHLKSMFLRSNPYWTFEKIMEIEVRNNVRSTFFFLNETKKHQIFNPSTYKLTLGRYNIHEQKIVDIIKKLDKNGWEIGVHGSYDSYQKKDQLLKEKEELEKILNKKIIGIRQHYLNLKIPETWKYQREVGFKYDSSYGYKNRVGFKNGKYFPFHPFNDDFLEIPLIIMDGFLFQGNVNMKDCWDKCKEIIRKAEKRNGLVTIVWHTERFNDNEYPGQMDFYEKIIKECKKRNAFVSTAKDIYNIIMAGE